MTKSWTFLKRRLLASSSISRRVFCFSGSHIHASSFPVKNLMILPPLVHSNQCILHVNWFYCVNSLHSFAYSVPQNFSINFAKIHLSVYLYLSVSLTLVFTRRKSLSFLLSFSFCLNRHPNVSSDALLLWVCKIASTEKTCKNNVIEREREREIIPHNTKLSSSSFPPKRWRIILNFINNQKLDNQEKPCTKKTDESLISFLPENRKFTWKARSQLHGTQTY
jgi:hypothetical protein